MDDAWTCADCGSRFYRSELPQGHSPTDKMRVHKAMGCVPRLARAG
jgi:hypothetical protein